MVSILLTCPSAPSIAALTSWVDTPVGILRECGKHFADLSVCAFHGRHDIFHPSLNHLSGETRTTLNAHCGIPLSQVGLPYTDTL